MTVVVNAVSAIVGGGANYIRELARELAKRGVRDRFIFYVPPEHADLQAALPPNIEWRLTPVGSAGAGGRTWWDQHATASGQAAALRRLWWDQVTLRGILRRERADLLFSAANFGMVSCPVPQVLFIQNPLYSSPLYRARYLPRKSWSFRLQFFFRRYLEWVSVRQATVVMTPSQAMLDELRTEGFAPGGAARVNHFGTRSLPLEKRSQSTADPPRPFRLLFPAFYYEHKNLGTLLKAMKRVRQEHGLEVELVTTADPESQMARAAVTAAEEQALAHDPVVRSCVRFLPNRTPEQMAELFAGADLFVYPTVMESFGFPLIEALACGMPIVASDLAVNHELAGAAPLYFQPFDVEELTDKIARVVRDPALRDSMSRASLQQARSYTWSAHVDRFLKILEEAKG